MHRSPTELQHDHPYTADRSRSERRIGVVVGLTALTMAAETIADFRERLRELDKIAHVSVELHYFS
ncbi:MAG: hypothetical protein JXA18_02940 [Chitinispirillaceae bacterium]|nr:hypothetical protein [Chitinispirillaceae bacterium]